MTKRFFIIGMMLASLAFAQRGGRGGGGGGMSLPSAGPFVKNRLEQMTDTLQLSKEQKKDVKTLMDEFQKEAAPLRDQMVKGRAQIAASIQAGDQAKVDEAVKSYAETDSKMTAIEMKAFAGIYKALDAEQKQKSRGIFVMMAGIFAQKNWVDVEFR